MARTSTYLNFNGIAELAFNFYKSVFGGEFIGGVRRFSDMPIPAEAPPLEEAHKNMIMHISLKILGGHTIMATDTPESMGIILVMGNNSYISLEPDSRADAFDLFQKLSVNGVIEQKLEDTHWGAYFGTFTDQFGIKWMINYSENYL